MGRRGQTRSRNEVSIAAWLLVLMLCLSACGGHEGPPAVIPVTIGGRDFRLELAADDGARHRGLSDRTDIAADGGMLFAFREPEVLTFVMRRCPIPIDIIFIGPGGRVLTTYQMQVEPPEIRDDDARLKPYSSIYPAQFAVELRGGTLDRLPVKPGQKLDLPLEMLKARAR